MTNTAALISSHAIAVAKLFAEQIAGFSPLNLKEAANGYRTYIHNDETNRIGICILPKDDSSGAIVIPITAEPGQPTFAPFNHFKNEWQILLTEKGFLDKRTLEVAQKILLTESSYTATWLAKKRATNLSSLFQKKPDSLTPLEPKLWVTALNAQLTKGDIAMGLQLRIMVDFRQGRNVIMYRVTLLTASGSIFDACWLKKEAAYDKFVSLASDHESQGFKVIVACIESI